MTLELMVDLETMGTGSDAAIVQIGAVAFEPDSFVVRRTYTANVSLESSLAAGLTVTPSTIHWWMEQSDAARKSLVDPAPIGLKRALHELSDFAGARFREHQPTQTPTTAMWSHATFDAVVLANAYRAVGLGLPWDRRATRDLRTLCALSPDLAEIAYKTAPELERHIALNDALIQAWVVQFMMRRIEVHSPVVTTFPDGDQTVCVCPRAGDLFAAPEMHSPYCPESDVQRLRG